MYTSNLYDQISMQLKMLECNDSLFISTLNNKNFMLYNHDDLNKNSNKENTTLFLSTFSPSTRGERYKS